jgi:hypothetical protein
MTKIETLNREISLLPENLVDKVYNFINYLKHKDNIENLNMYFSNETALTEWLTEEEDKAWENL